MAATLRDVALKAGVATSTVSRALRNHPGLPTTTCERIQALAKEMGYLPDPLITAWVDRRWNRAAREIGTIAWVTSHLTPAEGKNAFYQSLLNGAQSRAAELGYRLEEFWLRGSGMSARRLNQILLHRGIRGVCVAPMPRGRGHLNLQWDKFSSATLGYSMIRPKLHRAAPHQFQSMMDALRELRHQGYRRIGVWMNADDNRKVNYHWMAAALLFREMHPGKLCRFLTGEVQRAEFAKWVEQEKMDVVLGTTNGVDSWIKSLGLKLDSATLLWLPGSQIPGIDQRFEAVAASAIDLVINQIQRNQTGIPTVPRVLMVEGKWREPEIPAVAPTSLTEPVLPQPLPRPKKRGMR